MKDAQNAVAACVAYAKAQAEVQRLTNEIGEALNACATEHANRFANWDTDGGEYPPEWVSHLKQAYEFDVVDEGYYGDSRRVYMDPADQEEFLAEKCLHCLAAHRAIQQRKTARKAFGAAKRYVGNIGRRSIVKQQVAA